MTWQYVPGYEGLYQINETGEVWSCSTARLLPGYVLPIGYRVHTLSKDRVKALHYVHRLVLLTFVGPAPEGMEACHGDGNKLNNRLENLRWGTRSDNVLDMVKHGTHPRTNQKKGTKK